jgi:uncharacterized protein with PQ loop repeat
MAPRSVRVRGTGRGPGLVGRTRARDDGPMLTSALALLASGVFLVRLLPQPVRLARSGVAAGVSPLSALNAVIAASAWVVYGLVAELPAVWVVSVLALVPGAWTVVLLRRETTWRDVLWAALWVAVILAAWAVGFLGAVLACTVGVTNAPQVLRVLTERDLSGVAASAWWIALADAGTWGAYGWAIGDGALLGYAVVLTVSALVVLVRLARVPAVALP